MRVSRPGEMEYESEVYHLERNHRVCGSRKFRFDSVRTFEQNVGSLRQSEQKNQLFSHGSEVSHRPSSHGVQRQVVNSRPAFPTNRHDDSSPVSVDGVVIYFAMV